MIEHPRSAGFWTINRIAGALGVAATLGVIGTLGDPGITVDEPLDVGPGRQYVWALWDRGGSFFSRASVDAVFRSSAEHPPLARWWIGLASILGEPIEGLLGGADPFKLFHIHSARLAPALAFGVLVGVVAAEAGRRYGRAAAVAAGLALMFMPRVWAHAHLAALDTILTLFWTLALLRAARATDRPRPVWALAGSGGWWGLALLVKIHAWLLPPLVLAWTLVRLRPSRALAGCAGWAAVGLTIFWLGWPWLWYDSLDRWGHYLATGVNRVPLRVEYFGWIYQDFEVPWHYPWFYFAATVPIGLQALGVLGLIRAGRDRRTDPFPLLLAGSIALWLVVFSTRAPVYDGERLFLVVFPAWAILIGLGFREVWRAAGRRTWLRSALVVVLAAQGYGVWALHPFGLSYYNALVGGLAGAERLGLEVTYWADPVDPVLLDRLAREAKPGQTVALVPSLHHLQPPLTLTPELARLGLHLEPQEAAPTADWLVVWRRSAYWPAGLGDRLARSQPVARRVRQGVWLSGLWSGQSLRAAEKSDRPN